jgi:hypothetical protein
MVMVQRELYGDYGTDRALWWLWYTEKFLVNIKYFMLKSYFAVIYVTKTSTEQISLIGSDRVRSDVDICGKSMREK